MKRELEIKTYSRKEKIQLVRTFNEEEQIEY